MTETDRTAAPRAAFAERFALLYAEAGNPPLKRVTESVARERGVDHQGRPVRVPAQRISDWRRGRNVPARFAGLAAVLRVLIGEARRRRRAPVVAGLYDMTTWRYWWEAALASPLADSERDEGDTDGAVVPQHTAADAEAVCPYRGLAAFQQSDSEWFFGRERATDDLLARIARARAAGGFVVLVGASGAGKSSLLRAGLGPSLAAGTLGDEQTGEMPITALTPGSDPLGQLAAFEAGAGGTGGDAAEGAGGTGGDAVPRGVLIVDQFEELFTLCDDEDVQVAFVRRLHALCTPSGDAPAPYLVVLGVRADFYHRCLGFPELVEAMQERQLALGAMSESELREAVVRPAKAVGLQWEAGLVDLVLADLGATVRRGGSRPTGAPGYEAGALPLLSHALLATWQRRSGGKLTVAGYRRAGGIHGAVAATAERAWGELDDDGADAARRMLLRLVRVGDASRDVRRRATPAELLGTGADEPVRERALEVLVRARLVTLDAESVEITHEALLDAWPRLRGWIDDNRAENLARQRLEADAASWAEQDRDPSLLYRGSRLESSERLARDVDAVELTPLARRFVAASSQQHRKGRWLRRAAVSLVGVFALIAAGAAAIAVNERDDARFRQIVTQADSLGTRDPSLSAQLSLVAHRMRPEHRGVAARLLSTGQSPLASPLRGHAGAVYLTSFSPDGSVLATASEDRTVRLWDMRGTPKPLGEPLRAHGSWVSSAVFSADGDTLATTGADGTIRFWDVSDPAAARLLGEPLRPGNGAMYLLAFSPDGELLATANDDGTIGLWDVSDPMAPERVGKPLTGHDAAVRTVAFSSDGSVLASGSDDHDVRLWDVSDPRRPRQLGAPLTGAEDMVHSVAFSPDGDTLAVGVEDTTVRLWDVSAPARAEPYGALTGHEGLVWSVKFSPDGQLLASGSADGTTRLWNVSDPANAVPVGEPLSARSGIVYAVGFSPDGSKLAVGSDDGVARVWSLPRGTLAGHPDGVTSVAVGPGGDLLATGGADRTVRLWRIADGARPAPVGPVLRAQDGTVHPLDFSSRGGLLATGSTDTRVRLWDVSDPEQPELLATLRGAAGYFSPDATTLAVIDGTDLRLYDVTTPGRPERLADVDTGHGAYITSGAFNAGGTTFATGSFDHTTRLWDVSDPRDPERLGEPLTGHAGPVWSVAFHPEDATLATASGDKTIRLWSTRDLTEVRPLGEPLRGHTDAVNAVAFSPDGDRMVSGGYDNTVRMWTMSELPASMPLTGHGGVVEAVAFTPDGGTAVTGGSDGTARLWGHDVERSIDRICAVSADVLTPAAWEQYLPQQSYDPPC